MQGFLYTFLVAILLFVVIRKIEMNLFWSVIHQFQMIMLLPALGNTITVTVTVASAVPHGVFPVTV